MNELDQFVKHTLRVKNYARYTDDFIIVSDNREYIEELLPRLQTFLLEKLRLELHPDKITINKFHEGIDFLGYVIFPYYKKLRSKTRKRIVRKIREKIENFHNNIISQHTLEQSLQSYLGVLSYANEYKFSQYLKNQFWFWRNE